MAKRENGPDRIDCVISSTGPGTRNMAPAHMWPSSGSAEATYQLLSEEGKKNHGKVNTCSPSNKHLIRQRRRLVRATDHTPTPAPHFPEPERSPSALFSPSSRVLQRDGSGNDNQALMRRNLPEHACSPRVHLLLSDKWDLDWPD